MKRRAFYTYSVKRPSTTGNRQRIHAWDIMTEASHWRPTKENPVPNKDIVFGAELAIGMFGAHSSRWAVSIIEAHCRDVVYTAVAESNNADPVEQYLNGIWFHYIESWHENLKSEFGEILLTNRLEVDQVVRDRLSKASISFTAVYKICQNSTSLVQKKGVTEPAVRAVWDKEKRRSLGNYQRNSHTAAASMFDVWRLPRTARALDIMTFYSRQIIDIGLERFPGERFSLDS